MWTVPSKLTVQAVAYCLGSQLVPNPFFYVPRPSVVDERYEIDSHSIVMGAVKWRGLCATTPQCLELAERVSESLEWFKFDGDLSSLVFCLETVGKTLEALAAFWVDHAHICVTGHWCSFQFMPPAKVARERLRRSRMPEYGGKVVKGLSEAALDDFSAGCPRTLVQDGRESALNLANGEDLIIIMHK